MNILLHKTLPRALSPDHGPGLGICCSAWTLLLKRPQNALSVIVLLGLLWPNLCVLAVNRRSRWHPPGRKVGAVRASGTEEPCPSPVLNWHLPACKRTSRNGAAWPPACPPAQECPVGSYPGLRVASPQLLSQAVCSSQKYLDCRASEVQCKCRPALLWASAAFVTMPALLSPLLVRWTVVCALVSSYGKGKEGSAGRMGFLLPVPSGWEWLQIALLEGHNTWCILTLAIWTQINPWLKGKMQTVAYNC